MVFKNGTGNGTTYTAPNFYLYFFAGYDASGNLFFDGMDLSRLTSYLAELPNGSSNPVSITLNGPTLYVAGLVQWYKTGGYLALGDQECGGIPSSCIFFVSISGSTGNITGGTSVTTYNGNPVCDLAEGVIARIRRAVRRRSGLRVMRLHTNHRKPLALPRRRPTNKLQQHHIILHRTPRRRRKHEVTLTIVTLSLSKGA